MNNLGAIWSTLRQVIVDPTSNLTAAVLLLAAVVLVALIIVIALLLWVTGGRRPEHKEGAEPVERDAREFEYPELSAELAPELPGDRRPRTSALKPAGPITRWLAGTGGTVAIWFIVALAAVGALVGTSTDQYCADACHGASAAVKSRKTDPHKAVACVSCHEDGGFTGIAGAAVLRVAHLAQRVVPRLNAYAGGVPSARCLGCHGGLTTEIITIKDLGVRISHKEPLIGGMSCDDCHENAGHGGTLAKGMAPCISCHDGKKASSECRTCHVSDTSKAVRASDRRRIFPRVGLGPVTDCGGCHDQKTCDACHGTRMPHSEQFMKWEHARYAGFAKKRVCYGCHEQSMCSQCHLGFDAHQDNWLTAHGAGRPRSSQCGCHWLKLPAEGQARGSWCAVCH